MVFENNMEKVHIITVTERIQYYTDMYVKCADSGNNARAIAYGRTICKLIAKNEKELLKLQLFKK